MTGGTFTNYPTLVEPLPPLVRKQRRLEKKIAAVAADVVTEKAVRADIDLLLLAAGLKKSERVTCNGYDVIHNERDGQSSIDSVKLTELLVAAGVDRDLVVQIVTDSTETGDPAKFATVKPSKGSQVRT